MGLGRSKASAPEVRQWLGNLLVAWTFVTGLSATFASAWYGRTGDIKILIAYLGAPFLIGVILFTCMGVYMLATRTEQRVPTDGAPAGRRRRQERMFGHAAPAPSSTRMPYTLQPLVEPRPLAGADWERVVVRARPEEDDLAELNRVLLEPKHARIAIALLALGALLAWARVLAPTLFAFDPQGALLAALLAEGALVLALLLMRPRRLARRTLRYETLMETTYRLGPDGVEVVDARGRGRYAWERVARVRETSRLFLLATKDGDNLAIPKRAAGPETLDRLRDVLRAHAGERAVLRAT